MKTITLQVLEGWERGHTFRDLQPPVTIGREEENTIRLNDERVSRFHAKIQEDGGRAILTDLESTNGTRVNGRSVQMRILRPGDQITLGRCLLLVGSPEEIAVLLEPEQTIGGEKPAPDDDSWHPVDADAHELTVAPAARPPELPEGLSPYQRAQLSDFLGYLHDELRRVAISSVENPHADGDLPEMRSPGEVWQRLLRLEMDLAVALRHVVAPEESPRDSSPDGDDPT